jgi:hypothetical protein
MVTNTGYRSNVELPITFNTSLIAVWYSNDYCKISGALPQFRVGAIG